MFVIDNVVQRAFKLYPVGIAQIAFKNGELQVSAKLFASLKNFTKPLWFPYVVADDIRRPHNFIC